MEVAVNGIPVWDLVRSLDGRELLVSSYAESTPVLLDLLFAMSVETGQSTATRFLAAHLLNRVSGKTKIAEGVLALACLLISSKFLETRHIPVEDLARFTEGCVSKEDIIRAEAAIIPVLDYTVRTPTLYDWVSLFTLWISPYLREAAWQRLRVTSIQITELLYESGELLCSLPAPLLTVSVLQAAVSILTKCVGICGFTIALADAVGATASEIANAAEKVMGEALGWQFLRQFTVA